MQSTTLSPVKNPNEENYKITDEQSVDLNNDSDSKKITEGSNVGKI